jgi:hypothetical protein
MTDITPGIKRRPDRSYLWGDQFYSSADFRQSIDTDYFHDIFRFFSGSVRLQRQGRKIVGVLVCKNPRFRVITGESLVRQT